LRRDKQSREETALDKAAARVIALIKSDKEALDEAADRVKPGVRSL